MYGYNFYNECRISENTRPNNEDDKLLKMLKKKKLQLDPYLVRSLSPSGRFSERDMEETLKIMGFL